VDNKFTYWTARSKDWVIDRERDMYLRYMSNGGHDDFESHTFTFYWRGILMAINPIIWVHSPNPNTTLIRWSMASNKLRTGRPLPAPPALCNQDPELWADIREALTVYSNRPPSNLKPGETLNQIVTIDF
jgi:hypothetical protein